MVLIDRVVVSKLKLKILIPILLVLTLLFSVSVSASKLALQTSNEGYFSYDNSSISGTTLIDSSEYYNGTNVNAPTYAQGYMLDSLEYDGTNQYTSFDDSITTTSWSIIGYVYRTADSSGTIYSRDGDDVNMYFSGSDLKFYSNAGPTNEFIKTSVPINTWICIGLTYDGSILKSYYNTTETNHGSQTINGWDASDNVEIGRQGGSGLLEGRVDEFAVYNNRVLSDAEVTEYCGYSTNIYDTAVTTFFSITAKNIVTDNIINFSALINGTLYNTTNGTITTTMEEILNYEFNITIISNESGGYFNQTYTNHNISSDLAVTGMYQAIANIRANDIVTNDSIRLFYFLDEQTSTNWYSQYSYTGSLGEPLITLGYSTQSQVMSGKNQNFTFNIAGYYNKTLSINITPLSSSTYYLYDNYDYLLNFTAKENLTSSVINNFSVNISESVNSYDALLSSTTGLTSFPVLKRFNYTSFIDATNYAIANTTSTNLTGNSSVYDYSLWLTNSVYISIFDEETEALLNGTSVSLEIFSDTDSQTGITTNGTILFSDLLADDYHIRYSATGYTERSYFVSVGARTTTNVNLYLLNDTQAVNVTTFVFDTTGDPVESALVKMLKFYIDCNCYQTVQVEETDFEGSAANFLVDGFNSELYKFIISFGGTDYLETNPFKITSDTLNFFINFLDLDVTSDLAIVGGIASDLSFSNSTTSFTFTYSDGGSNVVSACLKVYRELPSSTTLTNSTCISSTAGTITVSAPRINGSTYKAVASVVFDGENYVLDTLYHTYKANGRITGLVGVFLTMILVLGFALISLWNPSVSIVLTVAAVVLAGVLGILTIGKTALMGLIAVAFIIILRNKS